jgi:hypothetical protein
MNAERVGETHEAGDVGHDEGERGDREQEDLVGGVLGDLVEARG